MANDIFLTLSGIRGESCDAGHGGDIEVLEWRWAVEQASAMHRGSGGGAGICAVGDLEVEHRVDRASPNLMGYYLTGKLIAEAVLVSRIAGGTPLDYLRITMNDVLITRVRPVGGARMRAPRERLSLSFSRVAVEYRIQNAAGGSGGTVRMGYDIKANKTI